VNKPIFLSFEGPDGSGKSTQASMLAQALRDRGVPVTLTREPGGTDLGEQVRSIILTPGGAPMTPLVMALLLSAARAQHVTDVIIPALEIGNTVITDRFADSTVAYQGYGMGLDIDTVTMLASLATAGRVPDVTVYIDVPPEVGLGRAAVRGVLNRLDRENLQFHERVRNGYHMLANQQPDRWISVDGTASPDDVHAQIIKALDARIAPKEGVA
jgi:dTMP kinase